ncbi:chemotaxis protein CheD [Geomicrobium sp. JCM 19039]|uniref:chemotaxis protein CheD n=1 Tax=Geomicrobium sp. JCM 19039 TaxID=1460636 RepID=UPI00045F3C46|nr:chemotaxis protein CheD [Geomicrobium sp. JCM 19039]GAK10943.1 chemotaxis protein CheD [Geomicrobium sp. JCM 19039]
MITQTSVHAGMGELVVGCAPQTLRVISLGSCIAVFMYADDKPCSMLAHVVLPQAPAPITTDYKVAKYADVAIPKMRRMMLVNFHVQADKIRVKIAGGAQMFAASRNDARILHIGKRNEIAVIEALDKLSIPIIASETGGHDGRTVMFNPETKQMAVRTSTLGTNYY